MLNDRVVLLSTPDAVEEFLGHYPSSVIFKAGTCHKTMQGFGFLEDELQKREDLMCGVIRVVESRPASDLVAERSGLRHESPQVILFRDGKPVFEANNWGITPEALGQGIALVPGGEPVSADTAAGGTDLKPYMDVLEQYLTGVIDEWQFESMYTQIFRDDHALRSRTEVEVLNSIFGDVDQHATMHLMMAGQADTSQLRVRAQSAYDQLKELTQAAA
ncbi:MAG TPA: thioredoxin family protein [Trueperaceae bacterium]|nr:thioredoxin family protein [Trueperaceae bacterium]